MQSYFIQGAISPERAPVDLNWSFKSKHVASGILCSFDVAIVCNQVAVWLEADGELSILDLKNLINYAVNNQLSALCFLVGGVYDFQLTRVVNRGLGLDYVFGVDNAVVWGWHAAENFHQNLQKIRDLQVGEHGLLIHRCLSDLTSAMRYREDAAFYCYRAIESLKHHYCSVSAVHSENESVRWKEFRDGCGFDVDQLVWLAALAKDVRHGKSSSINSDQCGDLLRTTWTIIDSYFGISNQHAGNQKKRNDVV